MNESTSYDLLFLHNILENEFSQYSLEMFYMLVAYEIRLLSVKTKVQKAMINKNRCEKLTCGGIWIVRKRFGRQQTVEFSGKTLLDIFIVRVSRRHDKFICILICNSY